MDHTEIFQIPEEAIRDGDPRVDASEGAVVIVWGNDSWALTTESARRMAQELIQAADNAEETV